MYVAYLVEIIAGGCFLSIRIHEWVRGRAYQTSVFDVNIPSRNASGGIHFTGSIAFPPFL